MDSIMLNLGTNVPVTRSQICDALKAFLTATGCVARFIALTPAQWKECRRWENLDQRPEKFFGLILVGTDSPFFYLA